MECCEDGNVESPVRAANFSETSHLFSNSTPQKVNSCTHSSTVKNNTNHSEKSGALKNQSCNDCQINYDRNASLFRQDSSNSELDRESNDKTKSKTANVANENRKKDDFVVQKRTKYKIQNPFACAICLERFETGEEIISHMESHKLTGPENENDPDESASVNVSRISGNINSHLTIHEDGKSDDSTVEVNQHDVRSDSSLRESKNDETENENLHAITKDNQDEEILNKKETYKSFKPFVCQVCEKRFSSGLQISLHVKGHIMKSESNGKTVVTKSNSSRKVKIKPVDQTDVKSKRAWYHAVKPFGCGFCTSSFHLYAKLKSHVGKHMDLKEAICSNANNSTCESYEESEEGIIPGSVNKRVVRKSTRKSDRTVVDKSKKFDVIETKEIKEKTSESACLFCDEDFESKKKLNKHICKKYIQGKLFQCDVCNYTNKYKNTFRKHLYMHKDGYSYGCNLCKQLFKMKDECKNHESSCSNINKPKCCRKRKELMCHICGKNFVGGFSLSQHIQIVHGDEPQFECNVCGLKMKFKASLLRHKMYHETSRPKFICEVCGKEFTTNFALKEHRFRVCQIDDCPYSCNLCDKKFLLEFRFKEHMKSHAEKTKSLPVKSKLLNSCDVCNKIFRNSEMLKVHMRIHTGEKPYSCDVCGKAFRQKVHAWFHKRIQHPDAVDQMKVPTEERPFSCDVCGDVFKKVHHVNQHKRIKHSQVPDHMKIPSDERPYSCDICGKTFKRKFHVNQHKRQNHINNHSKASPNDVSVQPPQYQNSVINHPNQFVAGYITQPNSNANNMLLFSFDVNVAAPMNG